jgi:hypothetical protein
MFNFFKNKNDDIIKIDIQLMKAIFINMPKQFEYIINQLNEGIVVGSKNSKEPIPNYKKFLLDVTLLIDFTRSYCKDK